LNEEARMPLTKHGRKVKSSMTKNYGKAKGTQVFYATANARKGGRGKIGGKRVH
jgi:hypothetical protein